MKKYIYKTLIFLFAIGFATNIVAQESLRERIARKKTEQEKKEASNKAMPDLSVKAQMRAQSTASNVENASWVRYIYKFLDLNEEKNAALYNPVTPIEGRMNLYTLIFKLMAEGKLDVYDFNNSQDIFTEQYRISPEEMFKRLNIPYSIEGNLITYDAYNIPSREVMGYYIKEAHFFDKTNSMLEVKVEAICPIVFRNDVDGFYIESLAEGLKEPQFWIPYSNIQPYLSRMPIMTSNLNNIIDKTIDDYFVLGLYDGEIYKTANMQDKLLIEQYKTEEELKAAREKIEQELKDFDQSLWVINDSIEVSDGIEVKEDIKKRPDGASGSNVKNSARERRLKF